MNVQEQEELDYYSMSSFEINHEETQQMGYLYPYCRWLLTDYDTYVENPFWDGTISPDPWDEEDE